MIRGDWQFWYKYDKTVYFDQIIYSSMMYIVNKMTSMVCHWYEFDSCKTVEWFTHLLSSGFKVLLNPSHFPNSLTSSEVATCQKWHLCLLSLRHLFRTCVIWPPCWLAAVEGTCTSLNVCTCGNQGSANTSTTRQMRVKFWLGVLKLRSVRHIWQPKNLKAIL